MFNMETMMASQSMVPAAFFYASDPKSDSRQHMGFSALQGSQDMNMYPVVPTLASTPIYSRPSSASQPFVNPKGFNPTLPMTVTPPMMAPRPVMQKPAILLETDLSDGEGYPSTPPLSSSSSVISSPGSCDMLQTPLNPMFSGLDGVESKTGSRERLESFPNLDWNSCASPPMTPVYLQNQSQAAKPVSLPGDSTNSDFLSAVPCPSLSPSPSPYARSVVSEASDFCDPRNLTVGTVNSTLAPEYSALPTLCSSDEEDHKFDLKSERSVDASASLVFPSTSFNFHLELPSGLPSFDDFSDLESEGHFVNDLVNLGEQPSIESGRSRASSDAVSLGQSSYVCEDDLEDFEPSCAPSPPLSCQDSDEHKDKRVKTSDGEDNNQPIMNTTTDSDSGSTEQQTSNHGDNTETKANSTTSSSGSENTGATQTPAPTRRGRKQSLTEDPSKTFVCDLCNRRFRRQEHLKRHYRSLHTQEKPFECTDCGKKFSRSDNLAQHARTHGSGSLVMNIVTDGVSMPASASHQVYTHTVVPSVPPSAPPPVPTGEDYRNLGKVLFQLAADIPGSASELSSDESSSDSDKRKRKRAD